MSLSNQVLSNNSRCLIEPTNLGEAMEFARMISSSSFCPNAMKGKPGDVIIAMQMGSEVGLSPMQAIQNIAVINGRPCLWGDAALAVVLGNPNYVSHREWIEGSIKDNNLTAYCGITRRNSEEHIKSFSMEDAKKAGLWGKQGPWTQYPERMLQMRARAFAIRDKFSDSLRGINIAEEVRDYQVVDVKAELVKPKVVPIKKIESKQDDVIDEEQADIEMYYAVCYSDIETCETLENLQDIYLKIKKKDFEKRSDLYKKLVDLKDTKKSELQAKKISDEYFNEETGEIK